MKHPVSPRVPVPCTAGAVRKLAVCLLVLWYAFLPDPGQAQQRTGTTGLFDFGTGNPVELLRRRLTESVFSSALLPMEGAVDSSAYVVGPGDYFSVVIEGLEAEIPPIPVTADGQLILPDVGGVPVAGLTLAEARSRARRALKARFRNVAVNVSLAQPRQFYVHVTGAVPVPGRYLAMPVARVATVLEMAFADTTRTPVGNFNYRPSLRNITLVRRDGTERHIDLLRYFVTGETAHNPYLSDGDVIYVPAYDPRFASVYVDGEVPFPGAYDHHPGETAGDLLALAAGKADPASLGPVRLTRRHADGTVETRLLAPEDLSIVLQPRDHLSIGTARLPGGTATIEGFVHHPGTYPIEQGRTTVQDLIALAGGLRPEASVRMAYLERIVLPEPTPKRFTQNRFELRPPPPVVVPRDSVEILQRLRMADLDFLSRAYFARELRLQNRVSVSLVDLLEERTDPVYLRDGDRLVVPRDEQTVYVFGQVVRPGFVAYVPGKDARYYIEAAGGAGPLAARAYVVDGATGAYVPADQARIESGDLIFLDRKQDIADSPEMQRLVLEEGRFRADARIRTVQTILQTAGTIASLVALIVTISRN
ncbi:SLBB domain-containing protein [Rhodocaloribacter litoris]|uniref:polysaccharide biosynthesis/export family protein n=1 Tax=Rhodocaloribacter litoris TaxID=2558931 RepID=UPI001420E0F1|nr:SLBB domain-containing protein [Rhodocaloribacter litoris]QXD15879.1 SLBB domain-containing protein [Rhodocaloribacter litoris]